LRAGREFRRSPLETLSTLPPAQILRFKAGFSEFVLIDHPDLIHRVLVTENHRFGEGKWTQRGKFVMGDCLITREGAPHRQRRSILQPSFSDASINPRAGSMVAHTERVMEGWKSGSVIEVCNEMTRIGLMVAAETLFNIDLSGVQHRLIEALGILLHAISRPPIPKPKLLWALWTLHRTASGICGGDMISRMQEAGLSRSQVQKEIVSMLIASVDTTPRTLAWVWFCLARHPEAAARLRAELKQTLDGNMPTLDDIPKLPFLEHVLNEVLRLYPPVHFIDRRALEDIDLDGFHLRRGEYVLLSPLRAQRDSRFFENPDAFLPERWQGDARKALHRFCYFPFGAGPHTCIGMGLARKELSLVVATIAQSWRLVPDENLPDFPSPQTASLPMKLERIA